MNKAAPNEQTSSQELYFLYELAKVFSSSLELKEVAEYILDGACALIGTELGFLCALESQGAEAAGQEEAERQPEAPPTLQPYELRGLQLESLQALAPRLQPVWGSREGVTLSQAEGTAWKDMMAAPVIVRDQVHGILGVATATARPFTAREQERLVSVANLGALALENARLHDRIQREVVMLRGLIRAAQQLGEGQLTPQQIAELEENAGWGEISRLSQAFALMARQVKEREEALNQKVRQLEIVIDEARRDQQIAEITDTDYFQELLLKAKELRDRKSGE